MVVLLVSSRLVDIIESSDDVASLLYASAEAHVFDQGCGVW